eukprot:g11641.t1
MASLASRGYFAKSGDARKMESADDPKAKVSTVLPQQHAVLDATFRTRRDGGSSPISCNAGPLTSITAGRAAEESSWKASISVWRTVGSKATLYVSAWKLTH